ncbi:MAG: 16S rRNA (adenine(1518)-N(6)/adenine(1519)-N(6))-dimethyltransferase RsmA [Actinobacteria bacterium]|nr:16S rRNA (adenine(1518)-N(6)/adenine(1519)-N(6))-dimethyltransferase RsmA [Actinomycetota bacterium]
MAVLLGPQQVRTLLRRHGIAPRRSAGQSFVVDPNTVRKVVRLAGVTAGDTVCEVGPGLGSLTLALREVGARVVAVEVDAGLVRALAGVLAGDAGVRVVHADALEVDLAGLVDGGAAGLVANLPYNAATPLVLRALTAGAFDRLTVMVQREVGRRWAAGVGDPLYGAVSIKVAALADARVLSAVSRRAFLPEPNVDSVIVGLRPRPWEGPVDRERVSALVDAGFAQRRKRLRNALSRPGLAPTEVEAALSGAGLDAGARAEELALADWVALAARLRPSDGPGD